ncbi:MAG: tyrosine-type recombinase/integrase [Bdellovibrionota bacterium]
MKNWDQLLENYMRVCDSRGLSEAVILGRRRELERWGNWLKRQRPKPRVEGIDSELILEYIRGRTVCHSKASVCGVMSHLRCMGEYLVNEGVWSQNPLRWIQSPKIDSRHLLPRRIEKAHLAKLIEEAANIKQPYFRSLMLTTLIVLYGTGMRRGELERLTLLDWNSLDATLRIDSRKVNLQRVVPVPSSVAAAIESYLPQRQNRLIELGIHEEPALFVAKKGKKLSGEQLSLSVHRLAKKAGIPLVTIHQFRHTCASDLLDEGLGLHEVQKYLGHAFIVTTLRYTQVADPMREQAVTLHPINAILNELSFEHTEMRAANE